MGRLAILTDYVRILRFHAKLWISFTGICLNFQIDLFSWALEKISSIKSDFELNLEKQTRVCFTSVSKKKKGILQV